MSATLNGWNNWHDQELAELFDKLDAERPAPHLPGFDAVEHAAIEACGPILRHLRREAFHNAPNNHHERMTASGAATNSGRATRSSRRPARRLVSHEETE